MDSWLELGSVEKKSVGLEAGGERIRSRGRLVLYNNIIVVNRSSSRCGGYGEVDEEEEQELQVPVTCMGCALYVQSM